MTAPPLSAADADRLSKLLGMLGSAHAGERAAAALKADELVRSLGMTWRDVIHSSVAPAGRRAECQLTPDQARDAAAWCLQCPAGLPGWEADFLTNVTRQRKPPSAKQARVVAEIFSRMQAKS